MSLVGWRRAGAQLMQICSKEFVSKLSKPKMSRIPMNASWEDWGVAVSLSLYSAVIVAMSVKKY